jgi:hypothetical protein
MNTHKEETCDTKKKCLEEENLFRRNKKFQDEEDIEEIIDLQHSIDIKIICNDKDDILRVSRGVDLEKLKATSESKLDISKIDKLDNNNHSQISIQVNKPKNVESHFMTESSANSIRIAALNDDKNEMVSKNQISIINSHKRRSSHNVQMTSNKFPNNDQFSRNSQERAKCMFESLELDCTWKKIKVTSFIPEEKLIDSEESKY